MQEQEQPAATPFPLQEVVDTIAAQLGETTPEVHAQLTRLVGVMGAKQSLTCVHKALEVEASGGLLLPDQSRRRTLGGVFFFLMRTQGPKQARALWRKSASTKDKSTIPAPASQQDAASSPAVTQESPLQWQDRIPLIEELVAEKGTVTTVKLTVIGRPGKIKTVGTCVVTTMYAPKAPALPKGLPVPPTVNTIYTVYVAFKQWRNVEESIKQPEDQLIIEGFPVLDAQTNSIAVFASSTTTRLLQAAQRQAQKAEA